MPTEIRLWQIKQDKPELVHPEKLDLEGRLENWIRDDASLVNEDLLVIGQQVTTEYNGHIDLLAIDRVGNLVILELKRDKTPRDVVAQTLDYASWVKDLTPDDIRAIANEFLEKRTLDEVFREKFGTGLPEVLNERHRMLIVASTLDSMTERIIEYLSETYSVDINAATFAYFRTAEGESIARSFLLDEEQVQVRAERTSKRTRNEVKATFVLALKAFLQDHQVVVLPKKGASYVCEFHKSGWPEGSTVEFNLWQRHPVLVPYDMHLDDAAKHGLASITDDYDRAALEFSGLESNSAVFTPEFGQRILDILNDLTPPGGEKKA